MGVMIVPFVSSLSDDVINAVRSRCGTALTRWARRGRKRCAGVVLTAALPGIVAAVLRAVSRAIGETMIVSWRRGWRPN